MFTLHIIPRRPDRSVGRQGRQAQRRSPSRTGFFSIRAASSGVPVQITVNGEASSIEPLSVQDYLLALGIDPRRVAVELNRDILPKAEYPSTLLKEGDALEIVHFVGGG
jgi:sulfur carrier protein